MNQEGDDGAPISRGECESRHQALNSSIENLTKICGRFDLALFGPDGRGGMQSDISEIKVTMKNIDETLNNKEKAEVAARNLSVKKLAVWVGLVSAVVSALASLLVAYFQARFGG